MTDQDPTQPFEPVPQPDPAAPAAPAPEPAQGPASTEPVVASPVSAAPVYAAPVYAAPVESAPAAPPPPPGLDVPIAPVANRPRNGGPLRWIVALLVVALVVAGGLGAALLLTGSSAGASDLAGYVPADSVVYAEGRLDLPGSQRAEVAKALSAFPGFADQAALDTKLGEVFDRIVRAASSSKHDYQTEIAPWFGGQLIMSAGPTTGLGMFGPDASPAPAATTGPTASLPACTGGDPATPVPSASDEPGFELFGNEPHARGLFLASVKDAAKAEAWVKSIVDEQKASTSDRTCDGVVVHIVRPDASYTSSQDVGWAILANKALVAGDLDSIRLAIATKGTTGLSSTAAFGKAVASLKSDHLGFFYEAVRAMFDAQTKSLGSVDESGTLTAAYNLLGDRLPEWVAGDLRASDGNFVASTAQPAPGGTTATNRASELAGLAPSGSIAFLDTHDVGKSLTELHQAFAAEPKFKQYVDQLDKVLGLVGGFDSAVGWIGDAGFALTRSGTSVSGGILIRPQDADAAKHLFTQVRSLADLSGMATGIKITDEDYKGATLTTVDLSSLAAGAGSGMENMLGGMPVPSDLKLVYAVTDKVVVLTLDAGFAKAVIDASQGGPSLAKDQRFSDLLAKAGASGTGVGWMDVVAVRELIENTMPADARAKYDSDYKPYLLPFDALISTSAIDNGLIRGTTIVSIKH